MPIRVAYIVNPDFGSNFSGHSHFLFSLLSGWKDHDIFLDLLGTRLKVSNLNSGDRNYKLTGQIWSTHRINFRLQKFFQIFKMGWLLIKNIGKYDIYNFTGVSWESVLSPFLLHLFRKKAVFSMIRYGNDNPSHIEETRKGKFIVRLLRHFDGIIGLAPAFTDDCKNFNFKAKLITLPNFMAIPQLEENKNPEKVAAFRSQISIPSDSQVLLYVGVAHKRKGLDLLIDAFVQLADRYPKLWLIIVGPRNSKDNPFLEEDFLPEQKMKIAKAGLESRVLWTGIIKDPGELAKYYQIADLFVLPTHSEGSPNVVAEAMYSGLPVIISDLHGITDSVVNNNETGFLVPVDETNGFVDSIEQLVLDPKLRKSMGENGRQRAFEMFSFDQYCLKLKEYYTDIMCK